MVCILFAICHGQRCDKEQQRALAVNVMNFVFVAGLHFLHDLLGVSMSCNVPCNGARGPLCMWLNVLHMYQFNHLRSHQNHSHQDHCNDVMAQKLGPKVCVPPPSTKGNKSVGTSYTLPCGRDEFVSLVDCTCGLL